MVVKHLARSAYKAGQKYEPGRPHISSDIAPIVRDIPNGALAQLGEHLLCKQGVIGSIPIRSTKLCGALYQMGR
mgnify:CR=1 FL=1|jgi:hypothetical protein